MAGFLPLQIAAFAFPMIHFGGMVGSAVALVLVDSFRLVLFVVSSISACIKYFHKITCIIAKPIDVLTSYVKLLLHSLLFALVVSAGRAKQVHTHFWETPWTSHDLFFLTGGSL